MKVPSQDDKTRRNTSPARSDAVLPFGCERVRVIPESARSALKRIYECLRFSQRRKEASTGATTEKNGLLE